METVTVNVRNRRPSLIELPKTEGERRATRLMPGENDVPQRVWDEVKDHPAVKGLFSAKVLELGQGKANPLPTKATDEERAAATGRRAADLSEFDIDQVKAIVADTDDLALLGAWSDDERAEVQGLVRARMRQVKRKR